MTPRPTIGKHSTYTVLGFAGYGAAAILGIVLAQTWRLDLGERLIALVVPPAVFVLVVTVAKWIKGREWMVFYQSLLAVIAAVVALGLVTGARTWRLVDIAVLGVGSFLVFGRLGCYHVACCHGRPARRGVVYGHAHVRVGLWDRLAHRPLVPVQLVEAAASALLVAGALVASAVPGRAAIVYVTGYACVRFVLELVRGDPVRPYAYGLSEAQLSSIASLGLAAIAWPAAWTLAAWMAIALAALALALVRRRRELFLPPHLREIDRALGEALALGERRETSLGVAVSCADLPDGRRDWILSSERADWSPAAATRLAAVLWPRVEVVAGRTRGVVHVIEGGAVTETAAR